jgi:death-on-curing protein
MTGQAWTWIDPHVILTIHEEQLAEHGGGFGICDPGLLESALARPQNLAVYGNPDVAELAAAYGFGMLATTRLSMATSEPPLSPSSFS